MVQNMVFDQHPHRQRAGAALIQRVEAHCAEQPHRRSREHDLRRDQLGDEDGPKILNARATQCLMKDTQW